MRVVTRSGRLLAVVAVAATALAVGALPAAADTVTINVVANNGVRTVTAAPGVAATVVYALNATSTPSGDAPGCNTGGGNDVTVTIAAPVGVTVSPVSKTWTFSACNTKNVTFSAASPGDYSVTASAAGGKANSAFDTTSASFTLHVVAPNLPPTVTVTGVADGGSYEFGSVPAAVCNVTDDHDGASTFPATQGALAGPYASLGLGSRTASCSYTDAGRLTGTATSTFSVVDTHAPTLTVPGDITAEATSGAGATVSFTAGATDAVDPAPTVGCAPASGTTFPLGLTVVTCTATDAVGNHTQGQFNVTVADTTSPTVHVPASITAEATGPAGADVTFTATADDTVDGPLVPACVPASGFTFALGATPVNCTATDTAGNPGSAGFGVTVQDTTAPSLFLPGTTTVEATGPGGSTATWSATAVDLVDGPVPVICVAASGSLFPLGQTTVACSATDTAGNLATGSFSVTVQDTTAPDLTLPADITVEATGPAGANVTFAAAATDLVTEHVAVDCDHANGTFALGTTTIKCAASDAAGNTAHGSFTVTVVDTTAPAFTNLPADLTLEATGPDGAVATFTPPSATDLVDGDRPVTCASDAGSGGLGSGDTFPLGTTTVRCTAADTRGNSDHVEFAVTVQDTTPPALHDVPANITTEATGPDGAPVSFSPPTATDLVDGTTPVHCDVPPGDTFALGVSTVACTSTDHASNEASASFTVTVQDTTAPDVTVPGNQTVEATGPQGATVTWTGVSARDLVDGDLDATCDPASGSIFALGVATVDCAATDAHHNTGHGGFTVTVQDTTAPVVTVPGAKTVEATGPAGAHVAFTASATDLVDGAVPVDCTAGGQPVASGDTFPLGQTTVSCTATDSHGNTASARTFTVTVQDTTAPNVTAPGNKTVEATGPAGAHVAFTASANDLVDGALTPTCVPPSGSTFPLGTTTVTCSATDAHANTGTGSFTVTVVDTTAPTLTLPGNLTATATSAAGAAVTYTATASDLVDGSVTPSCAPASGATFAPGTTTVACTATDTHGNSATGAFTVTVGFDWVGFYAPVDTNKTLNGMKAGSTAPLKWSIRNPAGGYLSDLSIVNRLSSGVANCATGTPVDDLDQYATGGTQLRYDTTSNQYVYNWQSPKKPGACYTVTIGLIDGSSQTATFQLR